MTFGRIQQAVPIGTASTLPSVTLVTDVHLNGMGELRWNAPAVTRSRLLRRTAMASRPRGAQHEQAPAAFAAARSCTWRHGRPAAQRARRACTGRAERSALQGLSAMVPGASGGVYPAAAPTDLLMVQEVPACGPSL